MVVVALVPLSTAAQLEQRQSVMQTVDQLTHAVRGQYMVSGSVVLAHLVLPVVLVH